MYLVSKFPSNVHLAPTLCFQIEYDDRARISSIKVQPIIEKEQPNPNSARNEDDEDEVAIDDI